jgi:hypothetical protein
MLIDVEASKNDPEATARALLDAARISSIEIVHVISP